MSKTEEELLKSLESLAEMIKIVWETVKLHDEILHQIADQSGMDIDVEKQVDDIMHRVKGFES